MLKKTNNSYQIKIHFIKYIITQKQEQQKSFYSTNTDDAVKGSGTDNTGIIVFLIILVVLAFIGMACMAKKEREGHPLFTPLTAVEDKKDMELAKA